MHIGLLTAEYPPQPGGVGDYTRCLAQALVARGHTLAVITGTSAANGAPPSVPGITRVPQIRSWDWRCWQDTRAVLERLRPDVLHIQYQTGAYGMHPAINLLPWRLRGSTSVPPIFVTFHDLREPYLLPKAAWLRRLVTRWLACTAAGVVVTNAEDAATLQARAARWPPGCRLAPRQIPIGSNIPLAPPPGYDRGAWRANLGVGPADILVVSFGLLTRSKGPDLLVEALQHLDRRPSPPIRLLLVGGRAATARDDAYATQLFARIAQSDLRDRITCTGFVDAATVSAHLLASDMVALPLRDGASLRSGSLLAALCHGTAIITTRAPSGAATASPLVDDRQGLLVPADDSQALAVALERLANNRPLRTRLATAAGILGARFDWQQIAEQHEQMYIDR